MKIIFLDIDGVLNSFQSMYFWHNKRDQKSWENDMYESWKGTLKEYLAQEFDPIAISNLERIIREVPEVKIVISSTWRLGETVDSLKKIFSVSPLIADAIIDVTGKDESRIRGREIKTWLDEHNDITDLVILDDDSDMELLISYLVKTDAKVGLDWNKAQEVIGRLKQNGPQTESL